ncbi:MAG: hypothetical protein E6R07_01815 [Nevskiaceae bacterium]|nr:MAG: hypothetical protein E6R07_01815 [Nevskiaceae bacterium]
MKFQVAREWADFILKVLTSIAIAVGGVWSYFEFSLMETAATNIQLTLATEVLDYGPNEKLLVIHVRPKNIGKTLATTPKKGFVVSVKSIPQNIPQGEVSLDKFRDFYSGDLMQRFADGYELEPGVEYDELVTLVVPTGSIFFVKAEFPLADNDEVDQTAVVKITN